MMNKLTKGQVHLTAKEEDEILEMGREINQEKRAEDLRDMNEEVKNTTDNGQETLKLFRVKVTGECQVEAIDEEEAKTNALIYFSEDMNNNLDIEEVREVVK